ncbi:MAG: polysaccharide deacetylase family protein [Acidobacteria bacterium]|nr:polysaccharide deacetylase family protein [Acidobacteriota bacterium]
MAVGLFVLGVAPVAAHAAGRTDGYVIDHVATKEPVVFLTVDDGSHLSRETNQYIRNLRIPITTFALPEQINRHRRRFVNLLRQTGMTFENHSQTHRIVSAMNYEDQRAEICAGNREVERVIRRRPAFFRPPGGGWNSDTVRAAKSCGLSRIVLWNVMADGGRIIRADGGTGLRRGDIVLLHYLDSLPASLEVVMREASKAGLRFALLRDHLSLPAQTP